jgi:ribosomal protein L21E
MVNEKRRRWLIEFDDGTNVEVRLQSNVTKADIYMLYDGISGRRIKKAVIEGA